MGCGAALPASSSMKQAQDSVEVEGEVKFRRDPESEAMPAESGTEWIYWRGALKKSRQVIVWLCVCV